MTAPKKNTGSDYKCGTKSPRSHLRYFERVSLSRNLAQIHAALNELVPRLLHIGQSPESIAHNLTLLATTPGFADVVNPVVNQIAIEAAK